MNWRDEEKSRELNNLIDHVYPVEELEIAKIVDLCEAHGIEHRPFVSAWEALLDEAHEIINRAEDQL